MCHVLVRSKWGFAYDFASIRSSMDASPKVRELRDSQLRQTLLFSFGFVFSICPLLFSWVHPLTPEQQNKSLKPVPAGLAPISRRELVERICADLENFFNHGWARITTDETKDWIAG